MLKLAPTQQMLVIVFCTEAGHHTRRSILCRLGMARKARVVVLFLDRCGDWFSHVVALPAAVTLPS